MNVEMMWRKWTYAKVEKHLQVAVKDEGTNETEEPGETFLHLTGQTWKFALWLFWECMKASVA